jgi:hypothetical protein
LATRTHLKHTHQRRQKSIASLGEHLFGEEVFAKNNERRGKIVEQAVENPVPLGEEVDSFR